MSDSPQLESSGCQNIHLDTHVLRLMIVDDHEVVRFGLSNLLTRRSGWEVVAEAGTVGDAIRLADEHEPDVIVMDIRLSDGSGIDACREIVKTHPHTKVIMLTSFAEDDLLFNAISAGAVGYVLKQVGNDDLVRAIEDRGPRGCNVGSHGYRPGFG